MLIPWFGLSGAAVGVAVAVVVEQMLTVATALRLFGVSARALAARIARPAVAAAVMAAGLVVAGLGWSDDRSVAVLVEAAVVGAAVYAVALLAGWLLAGRPAGAEMDVVALGRRLVG
jgi:O-antigen/teichoic acid export membrane protein